MSLLPLHLLLSHDSRSVVFEMAVAAHVLLACFTIQGAVYWMTHPQSELCPSALHKGTLCVCNSAGRETSHCVSGLVNSCSSLLAKNKVRT